jgi:hypothetical protein
MLGILPAVAAFEYDDTLVHDAKETGLDPVSLHELDHGLVEEGELGNRFSTDGQIHPPDLSE